jgi:20S proteasome subunit alpha 2
VVCRCEAQDGAVARCESKSNSRLAERRRNIKVQEITPNVRCVYSGLGTDYQVLLKSLRKKAIKYNLRFGVEMPKCEVVKSAVSTMQEFEHRSFVYDGKFACVEPAIVGI